MVARIAILLIFALTSVAGNAVVGAAFAQGAFRARRPMNILGRNHPAKITGITDIGVTVDLRDGGSQVVQFVEIWRIRSAFVSDEPTGTTVVDFANNRLFVATPVADLISKVGAKIPLTKLTAPNNEAIYIAASKVTDIFGALPGLHNPASKTVIGTRDGEQQVIEPIDAAKQMVAAARVTQ